MNKELTDDKKLAALEAGKSGILRAWELTKLNNQLKWWKRALWILLAGICSALGVLLTGCDHHISVSDDGVRICRDGACLSWDAQGNVRFEQVVSQK